MGYKKGHIGTSMRTKRLKKPDSKWYTEDELLIKHKKLTLKQAKTAYKLRLRGG